VSHVLIEETHEDVRKLLEVILERLGHESVALNHQRPHAAEIDLLIVEPTSARASELVRALRRERPDLPIVAVSIAPRAGEWNQFELSGYLMKPFSVSEIEELISKCISQS
jgi:DNA-binding NtrC family response regulator